MFDNLVDVEKRYIDLLAYVQDASHIFFNPSTAEIFNQRFTHMHFEGAFLPVVLVGFLLNHPLGQNSHVNTALNLVDRACLGSKQTFQFGPDIHLDR
jgi:hypothetical protein